MNASPYQPIADLSAKDNEPALRLNKRLIRAWSASRESVLGEEVKERLQREWGIELGRVEGIFRWDRGVTITLINEGIGEDILVQRAGESRASARSQIELLEAHVGALVDLEMGLLQGTQKLSATFIRQLHEKLVGPQQTYEVEVVGQGPARRPLRAGQYKELPNNPSSTDGTLIMRYCPPEQTAQQVIELCDHYHGRSVQQASTVVRAAWLHHRFTQIHPFPDGNGRIARALATLEFLREDLPPLIIRRDEDRSAYMEALQAADEGDLGRLAALFLGRMTEQLQELLSSSAADPDASAAIKQANEALRGRLELRSGRAKTLFDDLNAGAMNSFGALASEINTTLTQAQPDGRRYRVREARVSPPHGPESHDFDHVVASHTRDYQPRTDEIAAYFHVVIDAEDRFGILLHLHERTATGGGGFALSGFAIMAEKDGSNQTVMRLPSGPCFVSVAESGGSRAQTTVMAWARTAIESAVTFWGKSM